MKKIKLLIAFSFISLASIGQIIFTYAGSGTQGYSGDGGLATSANLHLNFGITAISGGVADASGNVYFADVDNFRIRKIATTGIISTIAGTGTSGTSGDGGAATSATIGLTAGIALDGSGNIFIVDWSNHRVRKITVSTGIITTVAGSGGSGYTGDGGAATSAQLNSPSGITFDGTGNFYIADVANNVIRKVTVSTGIITTVAGTGVSGFSGDGGAATSAKLSNPVDVKFDGSGNMYIADLLNNRIRKVNTSGTISTYAGTGTATNNGDGGAATSAAILARSVAVDGSGNLYISSGPKIRQVNTSGTISTYAGTGTSGYSGDGGAPSSAQISNANGNPSGIWIDSNNDLFLSDRGNERIRKISAACYANAGPNKDNDRNCCGPGCTSVQIGTAAIPGLSYSWSLSTDLDNASVAQPNASSCTVGTPRTYTVSVSGTGCTTSNSTVTVTSHTFTNSCCRISHFDVNENKFFSVFPNPAKDVITVQLSNELANIQLIDAMGKVIYENKECKKENFIDVSKYPKGIYFILVISGIITEKEKLIID